MKSSSSHLLHSLLSVLSSFEKREKRGGDIDRGRGKKAGILSPVSPEPPDTGVDPIRGTGSELHFTPSVQLVPPVHPREVLYGSSKTDST
jgi:hypothetical protein